MADPLPALRAAGRRLRALALLPLLALASPARPPSPAQLFGPLFAAVEAARLFPDSKTFADAAPKDPPAAIVAAWRQARPQGPALRRFVLVHFALPPVATPAPPSAARDPSLAAHVARLWPRLTRDFSHVAPGGSAIAVPQPVVVPGGRFRELYYWDSYFTMLGLAQDGRRDLLEGMIDDFASLVARFGDVPNGTRTYYLGRSQPPVLFLMADLSAERRPAVLRARLQALEAEHAFWMAGAPGGRRVVRMPDGALLNRYWDDRPGPRDESWAEDIATARASGRPPQVVWRDLRAGAESGWDYSSRWLGDGRTLATIHTTRIVPADLNALLWGLEQAIARRCGALGDRACAARYRRMAAARGTAITRWLWSPAEGRFGDWDLDARALTPRLSAATLMPLFVGLATPAQARAVAATVRARLLAPGGLRTTAVRTGQQWDAPNGWAPLQWIAADGLRRAGDPALARTVATRFLATVAREYRRSGRMLEKYDVDEVRPGGGGEYPTQDGFGWTNGVTAALVARYGEPPSTNR